MLEYKGGGTGLHAFAVLPLFLILSALFQFYACPCMLTLIEDLYQLLQPCPDASQDAAPIRWHSQYWSSIFAFLWETKALSNFSVSSQPLEGA